MLKILITCGGIGLVISRTSDKTPSGSTYETGASWTIEPVRISPTQNGKMVHPNIGARILTSSHTHSQRSAARNGKKERRTNPTRRIAARQAQSF